MNRSSADTEDKRDVKRADRAAPNFSLEGHFPHILNMTSASLNARLARELKTIDLPLAHWRILAILAWKGDCTLSDIRHWTVIDTSTLSRAVDRLEKEGLVKRAWQTEDSRFREIRLTVAGEAVFHKAWAIVRGFHAYVLADVSAEDLETTRRVLNRIRGTLEESPFSSR